MCYMIRNFYWKQVRSILEPRTWPRKGKWRQKRARGSTRGVAWKARAEGLGKGRGESAKCLARFSWKKYSTGLTWPLGVIPASSKRSSKNFPEEHFWTGPFRVQHTIPPRNSVSVKLACQPASLWQGAGGLDFFVVSCLSLI